MTVQEILWRLHNVKSCGDGWIAQCPAHHDEHRSLSIREGHSGILLHCFAGCDIEDIADALGIKVSDLFYDDRGDYVPTPPRHPKQANKPQTRTQTNNTHVTKMQTEHAVDAVYRYVDEDGNLLYEVVRYKPKDFIQRRPDGNGGYIYRLNGVRRVPYNLPRLIEAKKRGEVIFFVEGEKDADTLNRLGLIATTIPCGASGWRDEYAQYFDGAAVVIIPDNDDAGRQFAETAAEALNNTAKSVKIVHLPDLPDKGDVTDWINSGGNIMDLLEIVKNTSIWEDHEEPQEHEDIDLEAVIDRYAYTDVGNAERLIAAYGDILRYDVTRGKWLVWDDNRWVHDDTGKVVRLAIDVNRSRHDQLKYLQGAARDELYNHIKQSEARSRIESAISIARSLEGISVNHLSLDTDPWLFNTLSGTIDLRTGELRPHRKEDMITKISPVMYEPDAKCPRWEQFLREVFLDNEDIIAYVQRVVGSMLIGVTNDRCIFIFHGTGANGKSVFINTVIKMLGDYAAAAAINTFLASRGEQTNDLAALAGARMVAATEADVGSKLHESLISRLTGGDPIKCRFLYQEEFTYKATYKIVMAVNNIPEVVSFSPAIRDRIKVIPFDARFYAPEEGREPMQDKNLCAKLEAELPGILAWAVRGCLEWQRIGLSTPKCIRDSSTTALNNMDRLGDFLTECCEFDPCAEVRISDLWQAYLDYCECNRIEPAFRTTNRFSANLRSREGISSRKGTGGQRILTGLRLVKQPNNLDIESFITAYSQIDEE